MAFQVVTFRLHPEAQRSAGAGRHRDLAAGDVSPEACARQGHRTSGLEARERVLCGSSAETVVEDVLNMGWLTWFNHV